MATSQVNPDADASISEIYIAAPPERVFQALIDPKQVLQWWGQGGVYHCTEFHCEARAGGKWRSAGVDGQGNSFNVFGEYLEVDPPHLLVYTWVASWTGDVKTTVRWDLQPKDQGTFVRIRHSGFAAHPDVAQSYRGWPRMLGWLRALLERGETVHDRKPVSAS
jgi:uncharacterized protein YndB with AHSA1/START domain